MPVRAPRQLLAQRLLAQRLLAQRLQALGSVRPALRLVLVAPLRQGLPRALAPAGSRQVPAWMSPEQQPRGPALVRPRVSALAWPPVSALGRPRVSTLALLVRERRRCPLRRCSQMPPSRLEPRRPLRSWRQSSSLRSSSPWTSLLRSSWPPPSWVRPSSWPPSSLQAWALQAARHASSHRAWRDARPCRHRPRRERTTGP